MRKHAFTLIELLVVITVIAILIMILLPALKATKSLAREATCGSHKHDVGVAVVGYISDFGDAWWEANLRDDPWELNETMLPITATSRQMYTWGNPAVALTQDFDPYLQGNQNYGAAAGPGGPGPAPQVDPGPKDPINPTQNKQNYLSSARYFWCPVYSGVKYEKNYFRYGHNCYVPWEQGSGRYWGTDDWVYPDWTTWWAGFQGAAPTNVKTAYPVVNRNNSADTALMCDFVFYNWCGPNPALVQSKLHCKVLMLDGSVNSLRLNRIKDAFQYFWPQQPTDSPAHVAEGAYGSAPDQLPGWSLQF